MLVHRQTFIAKRGRMDEAVEVLKTGADHLETRPPFRVLTPSVAPQDTVVLELEFENLTAYESFWDAWWAAPETAAVMEKWIQVTETGGTNEIWWVAE